jgi:gluconolactonase
MICLKSFFLCLLCFFVAIPVWGADRVTKPEAKVEKLAGGFEFTEGATCDPQGNVYFTDQPNDRICKWSVDGKLSTFMQPAGRSNGMIFDRNGNLYSCADEKNELWLISIPKRSGKPKVEVLLKDYHGKLLNGPNDVWLRPGGGLYFTDPFYKREWWKRGPKEQEVEGVYYMAPEKAGRTPIRLKNPVRVIDDLKQPNGITGTPDGKTLYVADIGAGKTYRYDIKPDGSLANQRLFCEMGSDGMTIDAEGNLYLTGKGVFVFDKNGKQIEHIAVPEAWAANGCFGGKDRKTLFITANKGLYAVKMRVTGVDEKGGK